MENDGKDLGLQDDLLLNCQHLVCSEDHAMQTAIFYKDKKDLKKYNDWIELCILVRRNRSKKMYPIIPENSGETYCFVKHLLGACQTCKELGNRYTEKNEMELAKECFQEAVTYERIIKVLINEKEDLKSKIKNKIRGG